MVERGIIAKIDADKDVILEEVDAAKDAEVEKNAEDDEPEPAKLQEVIEVVTTAKLMTKVVTAATTPITAPTITVGLSAAKKRKRVVKQAQIEQDEAYARELEAKLNKNINWDDVIEIKICRSQKTHKWYQSHLEIFTELARMGYKKPPTKLTFYKAFFLAQWKFLIHTILQCMSAKRTSWNEFSSMESAVICLSSGDLLTHTTKYTSPALSQKVFANMRRVGKGFSGVETPLFEGMLVEHEGDKEGDADENVK
nr:hypothetical protein [Tanacetum cinerariifolium]